MARGGAHVDAWFSCPYHPDGTVAPFARPSADRKPGPGMAIAAAGALDLDLARSWVVGDSACDVGLARAVGAAPLLIGSNAPAEPGVAGLASLAEAVDLILQELAAEAVDGPVFVAAGCSPVAPSAVPVFPAHTYGDAAWFAGDYAHELARALMTVEEGRCEAAAQILDAAYSRGAAVFSIGNGGSASIANHFQCDHVKGVRVGTDLLTRVQSLSTNVEILTAIANDIGYEAVFEYQLQSQARPGDVVVAVSSSGRSPNIVRALEWCAANGVETIALTGFSGGPSRELATVSIHVDSLNYGVIEDSHQACMHLLAQYVRQSHMEPAAVESAVF
jgi:D-sedoheptulose 7-phosphate isomerase/D-glycero-D-manno-heptose 1,7-bisphosphate phosphatase